MKTISVIAYNRPAYLRRVLEALAKCRGVNKYEVFVSVDEAGGQQDSLRVAHDYHHPNKHVLFQVRKEGVDRHPQLVYQHVFGPHIKSDFNVMLEDDTVPSPDALELADWFCEHGKEYACLLLHNFSTGAEDPNALHELMRFNPWGWGCTREIWNRWFAPNWNCKRYEAKGWDWSLGYVIQTNGLKALQPNLSRTLNIGREGGVYETPVHFDSFHGSTVAHSGSASEYRISARLPEKYQNTEVEQWVIHEQRLRESSFSGLK